MNRLFTSVAFSLCVLTASATDYTDSLEVNVNGSITTQPATISLNQQADGRYAFALKNFVMAIGGQQMGIGNIEVNNVPGTTQDGVTTLLTDQTIAIQPGEGDSPSGIWVGPTLLGQVPVKLMAEQRGDKLYAVINIDMQASLHQTIQVTFGNGGYQLANPGFEQFHKATLYAPADPDEPEAERESVTSDEPNAWHSFMSASGNPALVWMAGYNPHTFISHETRPGSTGRNSVMLTSTNMFIAIANGTITTGRMNTGSFTPADPSNHAALDMSMTDKDGNGDPFYTVLNGKPDSLSVWVKFIQGTPNAEHPYATVSAAVTDGTYYQDPQDKAYSNVLGHAVNKTIATRGGEWQHLMIPFEYLDNPSTPRALLVTISTNADAGQGSTDTLYVDDISLVYNQDVTLRKLTVRGQEVAVADTMSLKSIAAVITTPEDIMAYADAPKIFKQLESTADGAVAHITLASADLKSSKTYVLLLPGAVTGIDTLPSAQPAATSTAIYNLQGQRVGSMQPGHAYIVERDGKRIKVFKR